VRDELISRTTRGLFRSVMTGSTLAEIATAFQDEGFAPDPDCTYEDSSVRRQSTQAYLDAIDWSDPRRVTLALRVFERLLHGYDPSYTEQFRQSLRRDGYVTDPATGHITSAGPQFAAASLAGLKDPSAIREQLDRIQRAMPMTRPWPWAARKSSSRAPPKLSWPSEAWRSATKQTCQSWSARHSKRWRYTPPLQRLAPMALRP
jgi:hypothetical protein